MSASDIAAWVAVGLAFISARVAWLQLRSQLGDIARQTQSLKWQPGIVVQFTDDADLRWQIDSDLHLQEIAAPRHSGPKWLGRMFGSSI